MTESSTDRRRGSQPVDQGRPCLHCGRDASRNRVRGLCQRCRRVPEICEQYPLILRRSAELIEDLEWLADNGANLRGVCALLSMTEGALWTACKRAQRLDLYDRLADREPDGIHRARLRRPSPGRPGTRAPEPTVVAS